MRNTHSYIIEGRDGARNFLFPSTVPRMVTYVTEPHKYPKISQSQWQWLRLLLGHMTPLRCSGLNTSPGTRNVMGFGGRQTWVQIVFKCYLTGVWDVQLSEPLRTSLFPICKILIELLWSWICILYEVGVPWMLLLFLPLPFFMILVSFGQFQFLKIFDCL